jgi:hypothetical protein
MLAENDRRIAKPDQAFFGGTATTAVASCRGSSPKVFAVAVSAASSARIRGKAVAVAVQYPIQSEKSLSWYAESHRLAFVE